MTENLCALCGRPQPDTAVACKPCADRIGRQLHTIAELVPDARAVAARQTRRGAPVRGSGFERPLPFDTKAGAKLDAAQNALTTWARHVAAERGLDVPAGADPLLTAARWLQSHVEWLRHRGEVGEVAQDVSACLRVLRGIVDRPEDRRWLGQCGADLEDEQRCEGDVYGRVGAVWARCHACGASFATDERRAWLDGLTRERSYTARDIEDAHGIKAGTIRQWVRRGRLLPALVPLPEGVHGPQAVDRDEAGNTLYPLQTVLDVAASEAVRRAEAQQRRARGASA